jgi:MoaA/NifB/PqqE/SkfB family radical SAM enzyme
MRLSSKKALGILTRSIKPGRPYHAQWLLTRRCNYRCRSCLVWQDQEPNEELSTNKIKQGLDILRKLGVIEIVFSGGNPLLRDDIGEIIEYSSRYFITTVYDNGSTALKKIDALRNVDFVAISLDTLDEKRNDYARGVPGAWKRSITAIEKLQEEGISVGVSPTISQFNLNEIVDITKYFTDRGTSVWYCLYWYDDPIQSSLFELGEKNDELEITDRKAAAKVCDELIQLKKERQGILITTKTLIALKHFFLEGQRSWRCMALQGFLMINNLGNVAGCHCKEPVASIFDLPHIWESQTLKGLRKRNAECDECIYLCYIFYSLHSSVLSNIEIIWDQWKNATSLLRGTPKLSKAQQTSY